MNPTNHNRNKQRNEPIKIPSNYLNLLKAREKSRSQGAKGAIRFGIASCRLKNWHEIFKPITRRSHRNRVITFDSHLKTALTPK